MTQAGSVHDFHARSISENQVTVRENSAIVVPEQIPVGGKADDRHRRRPKPLRNLRVGQPKCKEVRLPFGRKAADKSIPRVDAGKGEIGTLISETKALIVALKRGKVLLGECLRNRSKKMPWSSHGHFQFAL